MTEPKGHQPRQGLPARHQQILGRLGADEVGQAGHRAAARRALRDAELLRRPRHRPIADQGVLVAAVGGEGVAEIVALAPGGEPHELLADRGADEDPQDVAVDPVVLLAFQLRPVRHSAPDDLGNAVVTDIPDNSWSRGFITRTWDETGSDALHVLGEGEGLLAALRCRAHRGKAERRPVAPAAHDLGGEQFARLVGRQLRKERRRLAGEEALEGGDVLVDPAKDQIGGIAKDRGGGIAGRAQGKRSS